MVAAQTQSHRGNHYIFCQPANRQAQKYRPQATTRGKIREPSVFLIDIEVDTVFLDDTLNVFL